MATPATGDRNAYDRYWFNGYQDDGEFYFGIGAALYPNLGHPRLRAQHRARRRAARLPRVAARAAGADRPAHRPVRDRRARADAAHPRRRSTTTTPGSPPTSRSPRAPRASRRVARSGHHGRRTIMDVTRFAQFGKWEGEIRYDGKTVPIDATRVYGTKDRSWGVRGVGIPDPGLAPNAARVDAGVLPLGAAALGRPLHALRRVRGRQRQPLAHRRRGAAGVRVARRHPRRRGSRHRAARRASSTSSTTCPARVGPGTRASRSCTPTAGATTSTSSRSSASA